MAKNTTSGGYWSQVDTLINFLSLINRITFILVSYGNTGPDGQCKVKGSAFF